MIVGGAIVGNCSIGSDKRPTIPANIMVTDITVESTGRSIKCFRFIVLFYNLLITNCLLYCYVASKATSAP